MPDEHGFDHLREQVRCIEEGCDAGGPLYEWPPDTRRRHFERHRRVEARELERRRKAQAAHARRMKALAARENTKARNS